MTLYMNELYLVQDRFEVLFINELLAAENSDFLRT